MRRFFEGGRTAAVMLALAALLITSALHAATITVTTTNDELNTDEVPEEDPYYLNGQCSLREALQTVNLYAFLDIHPDCVDWTVGNIGDNDTIILEPAEYRISFKSPRCPPPPIICGSCEDLGIAGDLDILKSVTIQGQGSTQTKVVLDDPEELPDRIFDIHEFPLMTRSTAGSLLGSELPSVQQVPLSLSVKLIGMTIEGGNPPPCEDGEEIVKVMADEDDMRGGGIRNGKPGDEIKPELRLEDVVVTENTAYTGGGGIFNMGHLELSECTISNNIVKQGPGGGIYTMKSWEPMPPPALGTLIAEKSTISGNVADGDGGGIYVEDDEAILINSTVSGNAATGSGGGIGVCGSNMEVPASLALFNDTITLNIADAPDEESEEQGNGFGDGGGIAVVPANMVVVPISVDAAVTAYAQTCQYGRMYSMNSIVAENEDLSPDAPLPPAREPLLSAESAYEVAPDCYHDFPGTRVMSGGFNLIGDNRGCFDPEAAALEPWVETDIVGDVVHDADPEVPMLGPLADNGGPTSTHALLVGSQAIDGANPDGCQQPDFEAEEPTLKELLEDQRSVLRPQDGNDDGDAFCDIGAYELAREFCGDGIVNGDEECDAGEDNSDTTADACRTDCTNPICGDGVKDTKEACDNGTANSDTLADACRTNCNNPICGDGVVDAGEDCDAGGVATDTCKLDCSFVQEPEPEEPNYVLSGDGGCALSLVGGGTPLNLLPSLGYLAIALGVIGARRRRK